MHEVYDINWTTLLGQGMFAHVIRAACAKKGVQYAIKVRCGSSRQRLPACLPAAAAASALSAGPAAATSRSSAPAGCADTHSALCTWSRSCAATT